MDDGCEAHQNNPHEGEDSFAALDNGRKLLLWGIRVWVAGLRQNWPPVQTRETLMEGFALAYALDAIDPLEGMMSILAGGSSRQVAVNCPRCPGVTEDEQLLLDLVSLCQQRRLRRHMDREDSFGRLAKPILTPAAIRLFELPALLLADCLLRAGIQLPPKGTEMIRAGRAISGRPDAGNILPFIHPASPHLH